MLNSFHGLKNAGLMIMLLVWSKRIQVCLARLTREAPLPPPPPWRGKRWKYKEIQLFFPSLPAEDKNKELDKDDDEKRLLNFVFSKYDAELRPVLKKGNTVRVKFGISLHQIIEVVSITNSRDF